MVAHRRLGHAGTRQLPQELGLATSVDWVESIDCIGSYRGGCCGDDATKVEAH